MTRAWVREGAVSDEDVVGVLRGGAEGVVRLKGVLKGVVVRGRFEGSGRDWGDAEWVGLLGESLDGALALVEVETGSSS